MDLLERPRVDIELEPMLGSLPTHELNQTQIGVTGTRAHMPPWQRDAWSQLVYCFKPLTDNRHHPLARVEMHHGCCKGADTEAHYLGAKYAYDVSLHPASGVDEWQEMLFPVGNGTTYPEATTAERNRTIVEMSHVLLAAPRFPEDDRRSRRSGTWQTVRMAREAKIPIYYAMVNGTLYREMP
jgi:hypothetical protein